jgi:hypothetical protein
MLAEFPRDRFRGLTGRRSALLRVVLSLRCLVNVLSPRLLDCLDSKLLLESWQHRIAKCLLLANYKALCIVRTP